MLEALRLWWEGHGYDRELTDAELAESTRSVVVAIVQTLSNREFRRPELESSEPLGSAGAQRAFDAETVDRYRQNIQPEVEPIRREWLGRGRWSPSLEQLAADPNGPEDLRLLAIELGRLRRELVAD